VLSNHGLEFLKYFPQVLEEEAAKAARLAELKAKAEQLRQEKSYLFGLLKQVCSAWVG
jgi:hypothetical protein